MDFDSLVSVPALAILATSPLSAQTHFVASLDGAQHDPPVATAASGSSTLALGSSSTVLSYTITLEGLDLDGNQTPGNPADDVTGLHFHRAPAGSPGPVVFGLISPAHDIDDLVIDATAGTLTGAWEESDDNGNALLSAELANLLAGGLYLNVHTVAFGGGEIRGQVLQRTLADGLQLHIEFEGDVLDSSPNGFDGVVGGGLQFGPGVVGQAADFDGVDDNVLFPSFPDDLITDDDLTVSYWVDAPEGSLRSVISKRENCGPHEFYSVRLRATREMFLEVNDGSTSFFAEAGETTAGWHHAAFTREDGMIRAFLDGQLVDEEIMPSTVDFTNTATFGLSNGPCIGLDGTEPFEGGIDELRIYNRVLTELEITNIGGVFADGFESGDVTAWSGIVP